MKINGTNPPSLQFRRGKTLTRIKSFLNEWIRKPKPKKSSVDTSSVQTHKVCENGADAHAPQHAIADLIDRRHLLLSGFEEPKSREGQKLRYIF